MAEYQFQTNAIHAGNAVDKENGATVYPIVQSAGFQHDTADSLEDTFAGKKFGYMYSRISNPTVVSLEKRLTALDSGAGCVAVASGMAAISTALMALCRSGDHVISGKSLFGGTYYLYKGLIRNLDIDVDFVDSGDIESFKNAINENTKAFFVETIGNPKLDVPNLRKLVEIANQHNIVVIVDGTMTTPFMLNAKALGAHVAVYATTKYICGHGTTIGGAIIDLGTFNWKTSKAKNIQETINNVSPDMAFIARCKKVRSNLGTTLSPFNAFLTSTGLDTLGLRMKQHCYNANEIAHALNENKAIKEINYLGLKSQKYHQIANEQFNGFFGPLLTIRFHNKDIAYNFVNHIKVAKHLVNLGDSKTLVVHPLSTIYQSYSDEEASDAGVFDDLIRVAVGLEDAEDLIVDFEQAIKGAQK